MAWGFQTWDASGKPNNYGLVPVTVVGRLSVTFEQVSGSASYTVPAGYVLDYIQAPVSFGYTQVRRSITINGGTITVGQAAQSSFGAGTESAQAAIIVLYLRKV
ncbi:hypothetical protein [Enterobacter sp. ENT03]|uniref:hypothetical protein n=1 Tax=Enterobacter sp. ENT03 TaxID=2854780 RepID=UPI001C46AEA5|nr:hypothetical protein [Enterobacter sp. ENT03]MBV7404391.1 hypothetical protein [Enterobacter sp. ENT03]MBV7404550.1 hypothetical protein [Enterobacter sp. ENT03]